MPPLPCSDETAAAPAVNMRAMLTPENWMTGPDASSPEPRLTLKSQLEDLALVLPWVEAIAAHYSVPGDVQFAIELCLEEALSNIIRHGYQGHANQSISVACGVEHRPSDAAELVFTIEDHAQPFDPLALFAEATVPAPASFEDFPPGGQGIRLMRKFSSRLDWQQLPNGNRLVLGFDLPPLANP